MTAATQYAYTAVVDHAHRGYTIGRADAGTRGYTPMWHMGNFPTYADAMAKADELNAQLGLSKLDALKIVAGTMSPEARAE
jgi:hypothetical protein